MYSLLGAIWGRLGTIVWPLAALLNLLLHKPEDFIMHQYLLGEANTALLLVARCTTLFAIFSQNLVYLATFSFQYEGLLFFAKSVSVMICLLLFFFYRFLLETEKKVCVGIVQQNVSMNLGVEIFFFTEDDRCLYSSNICLSGRSSRWLMTRFGC